MSALKDVQRSLNVIRQLSAEENAHVQQQILELMLQASISQLKSLSTNASTKALGKTKAAPSKPAPLPIPKSTTLKPERRAAPEPSWDSRRNKLQAVKPQAARS
jgi:hypothetical protein